MLALADVALLSELLLLLLLLPPAAAALPAADPPSAVTTIPAVVGAPLRTAAVFIGEMRPLVAEAGTERAVMPAEGRIVREAEGALAVVITLVTVAAEELLPAAPLPAEPPPPPLAAAAAAALTLNAPTGEMMRRETGAGVTVPTEAADSAEDDAAVALDAASALEASLRG